MSLLERDSAAVWHPFSAQVSDNPLLPIVRAEAEFLFCEDSTRLIDGISSWWVNIHGHANPKISSSINAQLSKLHQVIFAGCTHEPAVQLAESLLKILPNNFSKIFYSDNGSTAVEVALKMAIQYWRNQGKAKRKIIAFEGGYHGDTFGSMSVSEAGIFTAPFEPYLFSVERIPLPVDDVTKSAAITKAHALASEGDICAFIYEPLIQGASGMITYDAQALKEILAILKGAGTVLIADEVMTGFGRTGRVFASDYLSIKPDIITLSKGITGGSLPLGVTACSKEIHQAFLTADKSKTFFHGHSYTANPLACSAAIASLELLLGSECQKQIATLCESQNSFAQELTKVSGVTGVSALGTILRFEVKTNESTSYLNSLRDQLYNAFLDRGVLLRPLGNVVYFMPPYCISEQSVQYVHNAIKEVVLNLTREIRDNQLQRSSLSDVQ